MRALLTTALLLLAPAPASANGRWLPARDKQLHFAVSAGITAGGALGCASLTHDVPTSVLCGAGVGLTAGLGKELYDLTGRGTPSAADLAWDVAGVATGAAFAWLLGELLTPARAVRLHL